MKTKIFLKAFLSEICKPITSFPERRKEMKAKLFILGLLFAVFGFYSLSSSQVPQMINYQGKLTDNNGTLTNGSYVMTFTIYDTSVGGNALWTETQPAVYVENGIFSVLLGSVNPIQDTVFKSNLRYLGVKVGSDPEMIPRKQLASVPFAFFSANSHQVYNGKGDNDWCGIGTGKLYPCTITDNVGIGITTPQYRLHVLGNVSGTDNGVVHITNQNQINATGLYAESWTYGIKGKALNPDGTGVLGFSVDPTTGSGAGIGGLHNSANGKAVFAHNFNSNGFAFYAQGGKNYFENNVGISTTTPQNKLDVEGGVAVGATYSGTNTAPTNGMIIEGKVGIGTWNPDAKLAVWGPPNLQPQNPNPAFFEFKVSPTSPDEGAWLELGRTIPTTVTSNKSCAKIGFWGMGKDYGGLRFVPSNINPSFTPAKFIFSHGDQGQSDPDIQTALVTIDQFSRVGIGTENPIHRLHIGHVGSNVALRCDNEIIGEDAGPTSPFVRRGAGPGWVGWMEETQHYIPISIYGTVQYIRLYNWLGGPDEIGYMDDPADTLNVNETARLRDMLNATGNTNYVMLDANAGLSKGVSSSKRYKENIRNLEIDPEEVLQLNPVRFQWKTTGAEDMGLIAEDVDQAIPHLVIYDKEGKPDGVKYDKVAIYLLQVVKAQQKQIEALKQEIERVKIGSK